MKWFLTRHKAPAMYGPVHIGFLAGIALCICLLCILFRKKNRHQVIRILFACGLILAIMEVFKQIFLYHVNGYFDWWRFPFQICSIPMYLCLVLPFLSERHQNTLFSYLDSFCFLGALCALLFPQDMLSVYSLMTIHSFAWHGILLFISSLVVTHHLQGGRKEFLQACRLFVMLAIAAEIINVTGAHLSTHALPDMFYISPFTKTLQPFFMEVQDHLGRLPEIIIYLLFYMLGCAGLQYLSVRIPKK